MGEIHLITSLAGHEERTEASDTMTYLMYNKQSNCIALQISFGKKMLKKTIMQGLRGFG